MKKILLFLCAFLCAGAMNATKYSVTVPAGTNACYIVGDLNSWTFTEMTKVDEMHYTYEYSGESINKYKYTCGPDWAYVEKGANGEELTDRQYSENDVVAKWASIYNPGVAIEYVDIAIRVKASSAPTIWWWGAGDKCPNTENVPDAGYTWDNQPMMTAVEGKTGWFEWVLKDVNASLGVTFKINKVDKELHATESTCYDGNTLNVIECDNDEPIEPVVATYALKGSFWDGWAGELVLAVNAEGTEASAKMQIEAGEYEFKMTKTEGTNTAWYGNTGTMTRENCTGWVFSTSEGSNAKLNADETGSYTFTWVIGEDKLSVAYPAISTDLVAPEKANVAQKKVCNGQVFIIRDGVAYDMMGQVQQ